MRRIHFMQQWFSLSDLAIKEFFFVIRLCRNFAQPQAFRRLFDERTILRFRNHL
ncbi:transposase [Polaromonas vacuolata]|uniref:transposase n=1 Tax=Polaromonas vacuolata TaxID=37448 RepID=UPI00145685B6